jgi:cyclic di-GMP phosphodiesterase
MSSPMGWAHCEDLARTIATRDALTDQHARRVQCYAVTLARAIGITDAWMLDAIDVAARLHDIGKLCIPDDLLQKPGPLTAHEYDHVKQHAVIGADMLSALAFPASLERMVRHHHENWDGTGYPDRLCGHEIPIGARVLAIVDRYDALTSDRPYRTASSPRSALTMIRNGRGTLYDPHVADAFLEIHGMTSFWVEARAV